MKILTKENIFLAIIVIVAIFVIMTYFNGCSKKQDGTMKVEDVNKLLESKDREADLKVQIAEYRIKDSVDKANAERLYAEAQTTYDNAYTPIANVKKYINTTLNNMSKSEKDKLMEDYNNKFKQRK